MTPHQWIDIADCDRSFTLLNFIKYIRKKLPKINVRNLLRTKIEDGGPRAWLTNQPIRYEPRDPWLQGLPDLHFRTTAMFYKMRNMSFWWNSIKKKEGFLLLLLLLFFICFVVVKSDFYIQIIYSYSITRNI